MYYVSIADTVTGAGRQVVERSRAIVVVLELWAGRMRVEDKDAEPLMQEEPYVSNEGVPAAPLTPPNW